MERIDYGEAKMKYQKQWIVFVNMADEPKTHITYGDVYLVTPDEDEAYAKAIELGDSMGRSMVIEGFDDTPQMGGFKLKCNP